MKREALLNFLSSIKEEISKYEAQGTLSPLVSSSGQQVEDPDSADNSVEYYVKKDKSKVDYLAPENSDYRPTDKVCSTCKFFVDGESCAVVAGRISPSGNCKLYSEGGEKMTEKTFDVTGSQTTNTAYDPGTDSTTEPDPRSDLAMQKAVNLSDTDSSNQEGSGTYSTTANSTVDAPAKGATTEPTNAMNKEADGDSMQLCNCMSKGSCVGCACAGCQTCDGCDGDGCQGCACDHAMSKAACDCCGDCGPNCDGDCCDSCSVQKSAELELDIAKDITKSIWDGVFSPIVPNGAARSLFRMED